MGADQGLAGVALGADRLEDPGRAEAVVPQAARPMAFGVPEPGQPTLLAEPALVGEPEVQGFVGPGGPGDLGQTGREVLWDGPPLMEPG